MEILVLKAVLSGLTVGAIYGLIGASLNLLYGVLRVVNFAHGEFVVAGAYFAFTLLHFMGIGPFWGLPLAFISFFALGCLFYLAVIPRLLTSDDPETSSFLVMFGISLMLTATMLALFEADPRTLGYRFDPIFVRFGDIVFPTSRLVVLAITAMIIAAMWFGLYKTDYGRALRAAIMNRDAVQIVGVDIEKLSMLTFGGAAGLAAVTGVLIAMVFPAFSPFIGPDYTLIGFIVIVLGGLGNPIGGLLGGVIFGLTEQVASVFVSQSIAFSLGFMMMIAVIAFRPQGLLNRSK
jgi:branched-chain amino acid transport system permease protein